jgi:hypothetical protein
MASSRAKRQHNSFEEQDDSPTCTCSTCRCVSPTKTSWWCLTVGLKICETEKRIRKGLAHMDRCSRKWREGHGAVLQGRGDEESWTSTSVIHPRRLPWNPLVANRCRPAWGRRVQDANVATAGSQLAGIADHQWSRPRSAVHDEEGWAGWGGARPAWVCPFPSRAPIATVGGGSHALASAALRLFFNGQI